MHVLVPFAVGLNIIETVQVFPASMLRSQSLVSAKSDESLPLIVMFKILRVPEVIFVMVIIAGRLSESTGWMGKTIAERENCILAAGSTGAEACHQVDGLLRESGCAHLESTPELSNAEGKMPRLS
jgi:hypothetical protein